MKTLLLQLDSDPHPSSFDRIVALDAGVDEVLSYGGVTPTEATALVHGAIFTRGPEDLHQTAVWVGGSSVASGELLLQTVLQAFFGPFRVSVMMDSNGCNTTAAATVAAVAGVEELPGKRAVVLAGLGPVGLRVAELLALQGARVTVTTPWPELLGDRWDDARTARDRAQAETAAAKAGFTLLSVDGRSALLGALEGATLLVSAAPLGVNMLREDEWTSHPTLRVLVDLNPRPPLGVDGLKPTDVGKVRSGKTVFGALGLGGLKMKVHKRCVAKLFEARDQVLDRSSIYEVARPLLAG
ncbi:MAG TPA: NAD(P)-dependent methylenetetrahydromethanopterin dehydrogenase [Candidatus Methylomirabilis sp.]|nr:NAD(P)-dependent methylenetetrahydromethanopterin dehydrogenase [Candidatus Methylomirabilis sp.]